MYKNNITDEESLEIVRQAVAYCPDSGRLTWKTNKGRRKAGKLATFVCSNGYLGLRITLPIGRRLFCAHRLAWFLFYGAWPRLEIDHINEVKDDNSIKNLRLASRSQNLARKHASPNKASGLPKGVFYRYNVNKVNPYMVVCCGKYLGYFKNAKLAEAAYNEEYAKRVKIGDMLEKVEKGF